ncbi:MAG TPA: hypothetical protein VK306_03370 [Acidimicrobiales bacterium]|nr:hypothetical protein [Acidimicrobiales bacterium]
MTEWHVSAPQLEAFRTGTIGRTHAASVEAHLVSCAGCRQALAAGADAGGLERQDRMWARIADAVDRPGPQARFESVWARATFGSPPLAGAAVVALLLALAVPLLADAMSPRAGVTALLAFAPLAPLLGVVAAFRPSYDPAGEITLATPVATMRLVLLRTLVVATASIPIGLLVAVLLPVRTSLLVGWVLPGLALCAVTLAVGTRVEVGRLAISLALGWGVLVSMLARDMHRGSTTAALSDWVVNQPATQITFALVALAAGLVLAARRDDPVAWSEP